jgi:hypothetical protein
LPWIMAIIINNITHFYMLRGLEWKWIWWILCLVEIRCNALRNVGGFNISFFRKVLIGHFCTTYWHCKVPWRSILFQSKNSVWKHLCDSLSSSLYKMSN